MDWLIAHLDPPARAHMTRRVRHSVSCKRAPMAALIATFPNCRVRGQKPAWPSRYRAEDKTQTVKKPGVVLLIDQVRGVRQLSPFTRLQGRTW